jgi:hypothetical protein
VSGSATVRGQTFDDEANGSTGALVNPGATDVLLEDNVFSDPTPVVNSEARFGVTLSGTGADIRLHRNTLTGLSGGISINGGGAGVTVADNRFTQLRAAQINDGRGIHVEGSADPTITHNSFTDPASTGTIGVEVIDGASVSLRRNYIDGLNVAVAANEISELSLDSDLLVRNQAGLLAADTSASDPTSITATNLTTYDNNGSDIALGTNNGANLQLSLNSSAVSAPIQILFGGPTCQISFSRGPIPVTPTPLESCDDFQTEADPQFADPTPDADDEAEDYKLTAASPLVETGDPATIPGASTLDQEGDPRRLDADGDCVFRRDIGADELVPAADPPCVTATYADAQTGDDQNFPCSAPATPCQTIGMAIASAGDSDVVHADGGSYTESVVLESDKSLVSDNFVPADGSGPPELTGIDRDPAIAVPNGESAGTIQGLTVTSPSLVEALSLEGTATVTGNSFPLGNPDGALGIHIGQVAGGAVVSGNNFTDENGAYATGIAISGSSPQISGNEFTGLNYGITVDGDTDTVSPLITSNHITGTKPFSFEEGGRGISVVGGSPLLKRNVIEQAVVGDDNTEGIHVGGDGVFAEATLVANRISGHGRGIDVEGATGIVRLRSDLVTGNALDGLYIADSFGGPADVQGITSFDNGGDDIEVVNTHLNLDSSLVGKPINDDDPTASCTITFSRGPADPGGDCQAFSVISPPGFVNPGAGDYHLASTSPLIDLGNPAPPAAGDQDFDGDQRALVGKHTCSPDVARRDIGADERTDAGPVPPCPPPPGPTPKKPKCKKKPAKKGAAAAKKKKCKRKKKA